MRSTEMLQSLAGSFASLPSGSDICVMHAPVEGPGGKWQAAIWLTAFNQFVPVIIPWYGRCPVVYETAWSYPKKAAETAQRFACLAAEVEVVEA